MPSKEKVRHQDVRDGCCEFRVGFWVSPECSTCIVAGSLVLLTFTKTLRDPTGRFRDSVTLNNGGHMINKTPSS